VQIVEHECLDHFNDFGEAHLRYLLTEMLAHYLLERRYQGEGDRLSSGADPPQEVTPTLGEIECRERLGGLLKRLPGRQRSAVRRECGDPP
jgi:hypothetical protein